MYASKRELQPSYSSDRLNHDVHAWMEHDDSRGLPSRWKKSTRSNCGSRAIGAKSDDWILPDKALHHYATLRHRSIIRETLPISFQTTVLYAVSVTNFYLGIRGQGGRRRASLLKQGFPARSVSAFPRFVVGGRHDRN